MFAVAALIVGSVLCVAVIVRDSDRWALLAAFVGVLLLASGLVGLT